MSALGMGRGTVERTRLLSPQGDLGVLVSVSYGGLAYVSGRTWDEVVAWKTAKAGSIFLTLFHGTVSLSPNAVSALQVALLVHHPRPTPPSPSCFPVPQQGAGSPGACNKPKKDSKTGDESESITPGRMDPRYTGKAAIDSPLVCVPKLQVRKAVQEEKLRFSSPRPALGCM